MIRLLAICATLVFTTAPLCAADDSAQQKKGPLRVYILSGQSNMLGKASVAHLNALASDPKTADDYQHIRKDGKWIEREDVWVDFFGRRGNLNGSYGDWKANVTFGPELGFGHRVGAGFDEQVLIVKVAWGGRSLGRNFRPPSSGLVQGAGNSDMCYAAVLWGAHKVLAKLPKYFPDYDVSRGYELSGFVWFQGWNDSINGGFRAEYEKNLTNLAKDLRRDFGVPKMAFIVGEFGQGGPKDTGNPMRTAQQNAVKVVGNAAYVPTGLYMRYGVRPYDKGYHYFGRADTMLDIGDAMGKAALKLSADKPTDQSKAVTAALKAFKNTPCFEQYKNSKIFYSW